MSSSLTHEVLRKSREERARIKQEYGGIPTSVWYAHYKDNRDIIDLTRSQNVARKDQLIEEYKQGRYQEEMQSGRPSLAQSHLIRGKTVRGKKGGCSRFPANVGRRLVKLFSEPGETIYDPCAGHNSRMQIVWELNRNYIGYDISENYIDLNRKAAAMLMGTTAGSQIWLDGFRPLASIELFCRDNRSCHLENDSVEFTFTSPPYWDLEYYGEEPEQLGWGKTYPEFLEGIQRMLFEQGRVLKDGRFCVINCNDFRKEGTFYPYHADIINAGEAVGFSLFDIIILVWPNAIRAAFATQIEESKIMPKQHEYLIVFRK